MSRGGKGDSTCFLVLLAIWLCSPGEDTFSSKNHGMLFRHLRGRESDARHCEETTKKSASPLAYCLGPLWTNLQMLLIKFLPCGSTLNLPPPRVFTAYKKDKGTGNVWLGCNFGTRFRVERYTPLMQVPTFPSRNLQSFD